MNNREATIARLRERLRAVDRTGAGEGRPAVRVGAAAIDAALPWGGLALGGLHEIAGDEGARLGFATALLARLPAGRPILWCRTKQAAREAGQLYGPGLAAMGLAPARLLIVETRTAGDALWAIEEGLRCPGLAAVVGEGAAAGLAQSRRLQLAAEAGGTLGLLLPPPGKAEPSAAFSRWRVSGLPCGDIGRPRWRLALERCRGGRSKEWLVEFDDAALCLAVVADLAYGPLAAE